MYVPRVLNDFFAPLMIIAGALVKISSWLNAPNADRVGEFSAEPANEDEPDCGVSVSGEVVFVGVVGVPDVFGVFDVEGGVADLQRESDLYAG